MYTCKLMDFHMRITPNMQFSDCFAKTHEESDCFPLSFRHKSEDQQMKLSSQSPSSPSSSSSSSSSSMSKFDTLHEERSRIEFGQYSPMIDSNIVHENAYSKHSAWVHPAVAYQNQFPPAFVPKLSWRKGKWTDEEEAFTRKLIDAFNGGYLKVSSSTTLRSFLAERLCCDPMRITKKFAGSSCIGKQVCITGDGFIDETKRKQIQDELKALEETFMAKVEYLHKLSHPHVSNSVPLVARASVDGGRHILQHPHPHHLGGYSAHYYPFHLPPPLPPPPPNNHYSGSLPYSTASETSGPRPRSLLLPREHYPLREESPRDIPVPGFSGGKGPKSGPSSVSSNEGVQIIQHGLRRSLYSHNGMPANGHTPHQHLSANNRQGQGQCMRMESTILAPAPPVYRPRQANTSADLFGRQYPTTIEQMTFLSSENLRKKLAADNTMPSNAFHSGGRMGMGDAAKFCAAAAHAYSDRIQDKSASNTVKIKVEHHSTSIATLNDAASYSSNSLTSGSSADNRKEKDMRQKDKEIERERERNTKQLKEKVTVIEAKQVDLDLEASDLLLNFFNAAGSDSSSSRKDGSTCGSSASGNTSNQGDGDDNFSDEMDADVSASPISGRSSSLSSDRSDNNSDIDYSSPDDNDCNLPVEKFFPSKIKIESTLYSKTKESFEDNFVKKKQRIS